MSLRTLIPLSIAILVFLGAVGLYSAGYYLLSTVEAKSEKLASQEAAKSQELEAATRAHQALTSLSTQEAALNQHFVAKADIVPFLEQLQATGVPYGAKVNVVSVNDASDKVHSRIQLSLSISGSFDAVMRTLGTIEYGPYDGVMTNVSLGTAVGDDAKVATGTAWTALATYSVGLRATTTATSTKS